MLYSAKPCPFIEGCQGIARYYPDLQLKYTVNASNNPAIITITRVVTMQCDTCAKAEVIVFAQDELTLQEFIETPTIDDLLLTIPNPFKEAAAPAESKSTPK
jgi:hypothetical protein